MAEPIIGIDLGTTNSSAAIVESDNQVRLIPYHGGDHTIPSVFAIDHKGNELVGHEAKRQWQLNPKNTVYGFKRLMGHSFDNTLVETMQRTVGYRLERGPQNQVLVQVGANKLSLPEISARILRRIRVIASDYLKKPVNKAVVTVPAYFTDRQRQAVKEAGKLIDLDVVRIINEPTAAAIAYGAARQLKKAVIVYDLGGGTFDVSVIQIRDRIFEVKATGGDIFLGGIDFDNAMTRYVLDRFNAEHGIDLSADPVAMQRIRDLAERTKCDLSTREVASFNIPFITMTPEGRPLNIELTFTRKLLEELTVKLVDRTLERVAMVLQDSKLSPEQIDEVMLVGGQTRMPIIQERLTQFFGKLPSKGVHPDEAVAVGAALYAHSLQDNSNLRLQLLDVIPMAIGLEAAGGAFHVVFQRNAPIPNAKQLIATTSFDQQTELAMRIFQGDQRAAAQNELLGEFVFSGIRPDTPGRVQVEVTFDVNVEGLLTMRAKDYESGREMKTTLRVSPD